MKTKEDILYDLGLGLDPKTDSFILEAMEEYAQEVVKNLNIPVVSVPLPVIMQVLKYCEDNQIYDKLAYRDWETDRKSTRLNSSHRSLSRMPSSA